MQAVHKPAHHGRSSASCVKRDYPRRPHPRRHARPLAPLKPSCPLARRAERAPRHFRARCAIQNPPAAVRPTTTGGVPVGPTSPLGGLGISLSPAAPVAAQNAPPRPDAAPQAPTEGAGAALTSLDTHARVRRCPPSSTPVRLQVTAGMRPQRSLPRAACPVTAATVHRPAPRRILVTHPARRPMDGAQ